MAISGFAHSDFEALSRAFADTLDRDELGAAIAVTINGEMVVNRWGGFADKRRERPFSADTLVPVYSTGKAITALVMALVVESGQLDYETPVGDIWPELRANGVGRLTVAQVMSHQSGLCGLANEMDATDWYDWDGIIKKLEMAKPFWQPGTAHGYHPVTFGFLAGEIIQRTIGKPFPDVARAVLSDPHDLDIWFGVPDVQSHRVADLIRPTQIPNLSNITPERQAAFMQKWSTPAARGSAQWRQANMPAVNMHATAASLAQAFAPLANNGLMDDQTVLSQDTLQALTKERASGPDRVLPFTLSWAAGLLRNDGLNAYGPNPNTVGHSGWGGSCVFADPEHNLTFAYVMNKQSHHLLADPRPVGLIETLYGCL